MKNYCSEEQKSASFPKDENTEIGFSVNKEGIEFSLNSDSFGFGECFVILIFAVSIVSVVWIRNKFKKMKKG